MNVIFFGTENFSAPTLRALIARGIHIQAVVTKPDSARGRSKQLVEPAVKVIAQEHDIPVLQPARGRDIADLLKPFELDIAVLVAYGHIIPETVIDAFPRGIVNIHPSLLPRYRGPSPIESAIINNDKETGISIMQLSKKMDAGPVYLQKVIALTGTENRPALYDYLAQEGARLLTENLEAIHSGSLPAKPQNEVQATYCHLLDTSMSLVDPASMTADAISRHIRAYSGFPKTKLDLFGHRVTLLDGRAVNSPEVASLAINCAENTILAVEQLVAPSGKTMSGADFARGYAPKHN